MDNIQWRTSSYSNAQGGHCVEVAETPRTAMVRDTKNREQGHLAFSLAEWGAFVQDVKCEH
nr:DUF397 domain-containing protein [Nocardiopsis sp. NRRL B-16309]